MGESNTLLPFLFELLKEQSRSSVKGLLSRGQISVNGKVTRQFDAPLNPNDTVGINYGRGRWNSTTRYLELFGKTTTHRDQQAGRFAIRIYRSYQGAYGLPYTERLREECDPRNKIFVLHRLDRDTSGIMMFAKNQKVKEQLQSNWSEAITQRTYVAVIEGRPEKDTDLIVSNLVENKHMQVYVTQDGDGKEAITRYRLLQTNNRYSLVELDLETGRKNQIRAQMQSIGHPIAGDSKYGAETNPAGRLMLHARRLCFIHPVTGEEMRFETRIPEKFTSTAK